MWSPEDVGKVLIYRPFHFADYIYPIDRLLKHSGLKYLCAALNLNLHKYSKVDRGCSDIKD